MPHPSWPNPDQPGTPPEPLKANWHWLLLDDLPVPARWEPEHGFWEAMNHFGSAAETGAMPYLGACPWPEPAPDSTASPPSGPIQFQPRSKDQYYTDPDRAPDKDPA